MQRRTSNGLVAGQPSSLSSAAEKYGLHQLESTSNMADVIKAHNKLNQQAMPPSGHNTSKHWKHHRIHDLTPSTENANRMIQAETKSNSIC